MTSFDQYLRLLQYVKPHWKTFSASLIATVIVAATEPAAAALLKPLLDGSFVDKDPSMITLMPLLLILLFVIRGTSTFVSTVAMQSVASRVVFDLRDHMFSKLLTLPTDYYDNSTTGVVLSKVTFNVEQLTNAATTTLITMVRDSLAIMGLLGWVIYLDWQLALIAIAQIPFIAILVKTISSRLRRIHKTLQNTKGEMTHILDESISGNKVVKLFGGQSYEQDRFNSSSKRVRQYQVKNSVASTISVQLIQVLAVCGLALMAYLAAQRDFSVGEFMSFFSAIALTLSPLKRLTGVNSSLQQGLAAAETVFELLDHQGESDKGTKELNDIEGHVHFKNITFSYNSSGSDVIRDLDLKILPGQNVALVGPSGSGKTTLSTLLPRFYTPTSGAILIDGVDIQELSLNTLRSKIAVVSQDVVLFNDTIRANIAYGTAAGKSEEKIIAAAKAANALEFIEQMPEGLDTHIGDNGLRLSGGQRQRIAIARALIKNAPILILDEATSALDTESEQLIQDAMATLLKGRTTITIAHRLSTIEEADKIAVLQKGRIVETGTHAELLNTQGLYYKLHQIQFSE